MIWAIEVTTKISLWPKIRSSIKMMFVWGIGSSIQPPPPLLGVNVIKFIWGINRSLIRSILIYFGILKIQDVHNALLYLKKVRRVSWRLIIIRTDGVIGQYCPHIRLNKYVLINDAGFIISIETFKNLYRHNIREQM